MLDVMAFIWRRLMFRTTVIAITGSVGKSTTKECLAAILATQGSTVWTVNNMNGPLGASRALLRLRPRHRFAVIEMGTEGPGHIGKLARLVRPDIGIVVAVARTHTNNFATLEDTALEKGALIAQLSRRGVAILNGDDERVRGIALRAKGRLLIYGQTPDDDVVASDVTSVWPERLSFSVRSGDNTLPVRTQLVGKHWLSSALAALTAAQACGVPLSTAVEVIESVAPFVGRMQPVALPSGAVVIRDEENGSIDTINAMVEVMREATARRKILIFSDMTDEKRKTRQRLRAMGAMAAELTDFAVFVGEHGHHSRKAAVLAGMDPANVHDILTVQLAAEFLKDKLGPGDLVFIKGRGPDHLSRIVFAQYGEIGCWTMTCRRRPVCDLCDRLQPKFDLEEALSRPISLLPGEELIPVSAQGRETAAAD
jgi:UDP-N-acetylmuramoyl-tripeptide--D-alanyl-D-alanine ligase